MRVIFEDYKAILMALMAFASVYPYFFWGYYGGVIFGLFFFYIATSLVLFEKIYISKFQIFLFVSFFLFYLFFAISELNFYSIIWAVIIAFFSSSNNNEIIKTFYFFRKILVYSLFPGAALWFIHILIGNNSLFYFYNVEPFNPVKIEYQISFYSYIVSIIPNYSVPSSFYRFSGIFEEPGLVGTVCALLLISDKVNLKNNENKLLLIYGLISFSLAFYGIVLAYFLLFMVKSIKGIFSSLFLFLTLCFMYIFVEPFRDLILERITLNSRGDLSGNNRTTVYLDYLFDNWFSSDIYIILFGYPDVVNDGYSSIKQIPVENGLLGVFSVLSLLILLVYKNSVSGISGYILASLSFIFFISLYQRPDFYILYFILLFSFAFLNHSNFLKSDSL